MANWRRWLGYGKAKFNEAIASGDEELARREAHLEAEAAEKPWLASTDESPTLDDVRARIDYESGERESSSQPPGAPTGASDDAIDFAEQQRQADARLAAIRSELGLQGPPPPAPPEPPVGPAAR